MHDSMWKWKKKKGSPRTAASPADIGLGGPSNQARGDCWIESDSSPPDEHGAGRDDADQWARPGRNMRECGCGLCCWSASQPYCWLWWRCALGDRHVTCTAAIWYTRFHPRLVLFCAYLCLFYGALYLWRRFHGGSM
jgi:hypothetical protein